jgi:putative flippase GtrA
MTPLRLRGGGGEFLRFATVAVAGLAVDISLAWGLSAVVGVNLVLAAATGFSAGAAFNYLLHEFWTFRRAERRLSLARMLRYGGALGATLATRLAVVYALSQILNAKQSELAILLLATILSFAVNYLASKHFVFKSAVQPKTASKGNGP